MDLCMLYLKLFKSILVYTSCFIKDTVLKNVRNSIKKFLNCLVSFINFYFVTTTLIRYSLIDGHCSFSTFHFTNVYVCFIV